MKDFIFFLRGIRYAGDVYRSSNKELSILFDSVFNCNGRTLLCCSNNKINEECFRSSPVAYVYGRENDFNRCRRNVNGSKRSLWPM
jgi:hypothetical protein